MEKNNISSTSDEAVDFENTNRTELKNKIYDHKLKEACSKISEMAKIIEAQNKQIEKYKIDLDTACLARDAATEEVSRLKKEKHKTSSVLFCESCGGDIKNIEGSLNFRSKRKTSPFSKTLENYKILDTAWLDRNAASEEVSRLRLTKEKDGYSLESSKDDNNMIEGSSNFRSKRDISPFSKRLEKFKIDLDTACLTRDDTTEDANAYLDFLCDRSKSDNKIIEGSSNFRPKRETLSFSKMFKDLLEKDYDFTNVRSKDLLEKDHDLTNVGLDDKQRGRRLACPICNQKFGL